MTPQQFAQTLDRLRTDITTLGQAGPDDVPAVLAADAAVVLAQLVARAEAVLAGMERRVETSALWAHDGARSAATWLARRSGASRGEVTARLTAARQCEQRPEFAPGFAAGDIRVRHLTLLASALEGPGPRRRRRREAFPSVADAFAAVAGATGPSRFAKELARWCDAIDPDTALEDENSAWEDRHLVFTELGGSVLFQGSLPLAEGRLLKRRCEAVAAHQRKEDSADTGAPRPGRPALLVDALCHLVEVAAASNAVPAIDGVPPQILVIVPATDLGHAFAPAGGSADHHPTGHAGGSPPGNLGPQPPAPTDRQPPDRARSHAPVLLGNGHQPAGITAAQARRLACGDAEIRRLLLNADSVVTDLGRTRRIATRDQRRYLLLRDGGCRFAGCGMPADRCQPHHLHHWADGGPTDVSQMACLCTHCHHLVHEGGYQLTGNPEDDLTTLRPDGTQLGPTHPAPSPTLLAV
ncbi:MAG: DUF222 domain-containing protein [Candidatus Nanopelagicales bacterium]